MTVSPPPAPEIGYLRGQPEQTEPEGTLANFPLVLHLRWTTTTWGSHQWRNYHVAGRTWATIPTARTKLSPPQNTGSKFGVTVMGQPAVTHGCRDIFPVAQASERSRFLRVLLWPQSWLVGPIAPMLAIPSDPTSIPIPSSKAPPLWLIQPNVSAAETVLLRNKHALLFTFRPVCLHMRPRDKRGF